MKTIFLVDGAAGTGKSDLLRYLTQKKKPTAVLVPKYTTRAPRPEEQKKRTPLDLRFPPDTHSEFMERTQDPSFYWYSYGAMDTSQDLYGFYRSDITRALQDHELVLIIVRDCETIIQVRNDLPNVRCVSVF